MVALVEVKYVDLKTCIILHFTVVKSYTLPRLDSHWLKDGPDLCTRNDAVQETYKMAISFFREL